MKQRRNASFSTLPSGPRGRDGERERESVWKGESKRGVRGERRKLGRGSICKKMSVKNVIWVCSCVKFCRRKVWILHALPLGLFFNLRAILIILTYFAYFKEVTCCWRVLAVRNLEPNGLGFKHRNKSEVLIVVISITLKHRAVFEDMDMSVSLQTYVQIRPDMCTAPFRHTHGSI